MVPVAAACHNRHVDDLTRLAVSAGSGDPDAIRSFVRRAQPEVWQLCAGLVGRDNADDLTQDSFIRILRALEAFRGDATARTWMLRITRYTCADWIRARQRRRRLDQQVGELALTVTAASSATLWMPYEQACGEHGDAYAQLVGLNLLKGFRQAVAERLGGTRGCTHLTELCQVLPTAVIQAMAGSVIDTREGDAAGSPPFQLDRCHALRRDGATVAKFYPRWHQSAAPAANDS